MSNKEIESIAQTVIADKIAKSEIVHMPWAVQEVINRLRIDISGEGAEFCMLCTREYIYRIVKKAVGKYDQESSHGDLQQTTLFGYEHLQNAYTFERDNEIELVPIYLISDKELLERAAQYVKQSEGLAVHAEEIRRFVDKRQIAAGGK